MTKLADDRADQLRRDPDKTAVELEARLRSTLRQTGDFRRVHALPRTTQDVPDDLDARLVVLGPEAPHSKEADSPAVSAAKNFLANRGSSPRLFQNSLVFLAADAARLVELDDAVRRFLAWRSILDERDALDLSPHQVRQAEIQRAAADGTVNARLPETFAYAEERDAATGRLRGVRAGELVALPDPAAPGMLVKPEVALRHLDEEAAKRRPVEGAPGPPSTGGVVGEGSAPRVGPDGAHRAVESGDAAPLPHPRHAASTARCASTARASDWTPAASRTRLSRIWPVWSAPMSP